MRSEGAFLFLLFPASNWMIFLFGAGFIDRLKIPIQERVVLFGHPSRDGLLEKGQRALAEPDVRAALMGEPHGDADILPGVVDPRLAVPRTVEDIVRKAVFCWTDRMR